MKKNRIHQYIAQIGMVVLAAGLLAGCPKSDQPSDTGTPVTTIGPNKAVNSVEKSAGAIRPAVTAKGNIASGETITIGLVASLNGSERAWGVDSREGAQMAVDEINAAGGIQGKKVELKVEDSNSNPEQGKSAAEKLISEGVLGVLGEVASGITIQMAKSAFSKGVPVVAIGATRDDLTNEGNHVFRVCYVDSFQGPVMAEFAFKDLNVKRVAIITDKSLPYSTGLSNSFKAHFKKLGGEVLAEEFYEKGQTQFAGQLNNIKSKNPDGIFLSGYFTEVGPIIKQAGEVGLKTKFFGGDGWDSKEILNSGGEAIIGSYFSNHYNDKDTRPQVQEFLKKWRSKHSGKDPGTTMGALGYDAAKLMLDALKRSKELNSAGLIKALDETENLELVSGKVTLKGMNGNPQKRALVVRVDKSGFVFAKAIEPGDLTK